MAYREAEQVDAYPVYLRDAANRIQRVPSGRQSHIGRDSRCEVVVYDLEVEWQHCIVVVEGAALRVIALGPTFVDDVAVGTDLATSVLARPGSTIRIMTHRLRLETGGRVERDYDHMLAERREMRKVHMARSFAGSLEEVPLPDLLALFETSKKTGVLVMRREDDVVGRIHLRKGVIVHVSLDDLEATKESHVRAMLRELLRWDRGHYDLDPPVESPPETVSLLGTKLLLEYRAKS